MGRYNGERRSLLQAARRLVDKGWDVGLTLRKGLAAGPRWDKESDNEILAHHFDGISIVLDDGLIVLDIDKPHWSPPGFKVLPPTFKEKSPRGTHLFYQTKAEIGLAKIGWQDGVDILTYDCGDDWGYCSDYDEFEGHVLVAPTKGYTRIWPEEVPDRDKIAEAPDWLIEATFDIREPRLKLGGDMIGMSKPDFDDSDIPF